MDMRASGIIKNNEKRKSSEDDDDEALGIENVLADLQDVDYKTYKITKEEIDKYKETMRLRMEFSEEKRYH